MKRLEYFRTSNLRFSSTLVPLIFFKSQRWRLRGEEEEGEQVLEDWSADWGGGGVTLEEDLRVLPTLRPGALDSY